MSQQKYSFRFCVGTVRFGLGELSDYLFTGGGEAEETLQIGENTVVFA